MVDLHSPELRHLTPVVSRRISWSSVWAGVVIATSICVVLNLLALSFGLTFGGPNSPGSAGGIAWTTVIFYLVISVASLFVGAVVAARMSNVPKVFTGVLHGLLVWAVTVILSLSMIVYSVGTAASWLTGALGSMGSVLGQVTQAVLPADVNAQLGQLDSSLPELKNEAREILRQTDNPNLQPKALGEDARAARGAIGDAARDVMKSPGDAGADLQALWGRLVRISEGTLQSISTEDLANVIAARSRLGQQEARQVAERWKQQIDQTLTKIQNESAAALDQAMDRVASVSLIAFFIFLVGAGASAFGGRLGTPASSDLT